MRFIGIRTTGTALSFALALALPAVGHCDATSINGTCVYGNCTTPDSLTNSSTSSSTSNTILVDGSPFLISTAFSASESGSSLNYGFAYTVTYVGTSPLTATETVAIAFLQNFTDPAISNWDGTYSYNDSQYLDTGTSFTSSLLLDDQNVGPLGPFDGPGLQGSSASANLSGLNGDTVDMEQLDTLTFNAGDSYGTTVSTYPFATPEPSSLLLLATGLALPASMLRRRFRRGSPDAKSSLVC